jgi:hypothetical protein
MAEFLHILAEQYDYPQLGEEVLRELSNKEFNSNDTRGPKSVSTFMVKLSELAPRLVIKQMTMLAKQLDSEVCAHSVSSNACSEANSLNPVLYSAMRPCRSLRQHAYLLEQARRTGRELQVTAQCVL